MLTSLYFKPKNLSETLSILAREGREAKLVAGGTDLVLMLKRREEVAHSLVDISAVSELRYIVEESDLVRIGALATHNDLIE